MRRVGAGERSANRSGSERAKKGKLPYLRKDASDRKGQPKSETTIMLQTNRRGRGRMTSFEQAKEVLKRCFGHDGFRPEQERAIKAIMGKRDVLAVMSTGAGKSLIYQVPAVALGGTSIVVSPLVALMSDQVGKLLDLGLHPAFLNNTLSLRAQERVRNRIKNGEFQILYVAPERLSSPAFLSAIENLAIPLIAVDEAHCISEWGHDFRSDYREISTFIERFDQRPTVVALTATATPRVRKDIARSLGLQNPLEIVSSFDRANLSLSVVHMPHDERGSWCVRAARSRRSECGIFYCVTISEAEADPRRAQAGRRARRALPRQAGKRREEGGAGCVHVGTGAGDGRDVGLRHGHRQTRCALRGLLRHAAFNRELLSADRPRGARRRARRHDHAMGRARPANRLVHGGSGRRRPE